MVYSNSQSLAEPVAFLFGLFFVGEAGSALSPERVDFGEESFTLSVPIEKHTARNMPMRFQNLAGWLLTIVWMAHSFSSCEVEWTGMRKGFLGVMSNGPSAMTL